MPDLISFVTPAASTAAAPVDSARSLATNFDTFLTILTAQIQNQDPLEPLDSSQFTEQLVQFSGVEQQIRANTQLETLISATRSSAGASLSGYLGQQAEISTAGAQFSGAPVNWRYTLPSDAALATVTVTDARGAVVFSQAGEKKAGGHEFTWSGEVFGGAAAPAGAYFINVVAEDANGAALAPQHSLLANITGVDLTYGEPALTTSAGIFAYSDILRLTRQ
ncbi:MAG: flagellar hook capping FlgD N-terminal domain-containing protein [Alphaproteobacteria bacterium]|nr:flagellar hook capping FlgD N-terminal domain-containing protein [Alphaproteobacteria bacterium]